MRRFVAFKSNVLIAIPEQQRVLARVRGSRSSFQSTRHLASRSSSKRRSISMNDEPFPLRTRIDIETLSPSWKISHDTPVCFIGSCFSSNIYHTMKTLKFPVFTNPQGILFNPISIANCLENVVIHRQFELSDLFLDHHPDRPYYHSYVHHSDYDHPQPQQALTKINTDITNAHTFLQQAKVLFITLGTAKVYYLRGDPLQRIVANCHKQPGSLFESRILSVEEIVSTYQLLLSKLFSFNSQLQVVFTVSPIRHTRDGIVTNSFSKSILHYSIHQLLSLSSSNHSNLSPVTYFPAYEFMIDDLRDYRYYESDLIHPNRLAIDYIFHYFSQTYFSAPTLEIIPEINKLSQHLQHRSKDPTSPLHQRSIEYALKKMQEIEEKTHYRICYEEERRLLLH